MKFVVALVLFVSSHFAFAQSFQSSLLNVTLPQEDMQALTSLAPISNVNELLKKIHDLFPEVYFVRVPPQKSIPPLEPQLITWRDDRVSRDEELAYQKLLIQHKYELAGQYFPRYWTSFLGEDRPFLDQPVVMLNIWNDKASIVHELVHYLIDRERVRNLGVLRAYAYLIWLRHRIADGLEEYRVAKSDADPIGEMGAILRVASARTENLIAEYIEEVEVVAFLLENRAQLGLSTVHMADQFFYAEEKLRTGRLKLYENFELFEDIVATMNEVQGPILTRLERFRASFGDHKAALGTLSQRLYKHGLFSVTGVISSGTQCLNMLAD